MENFDSCDINRNEIFNHDFSWPGASGDFPSGWQSAKGWKASAIVWDLDYSIKIHNTTHHMASISQQLKYKVPVYRDQVWRVSVSFRVEKKINVIVIVYFINSSSRISRAILEFAANPDNGNYEGLVYIPPGANYCYLEIGFKERGTLWVEDVYFGRVYPIPRYDADARGRLNINSVECVQFIQEPVQVKGEISTITQTYNLFEELLAGPEEGHSSVHDVIALSRYSFCVFNQGDNDVLIYLQVSPNGDNWMNDSAGDNPLEVGKMRVLVSNYFLRYLRLAFFTTDGLSNLKIYFQGQD